MEKIQQALLIALIAVLAVIMYLRLLRLLKNKRVSNSYSSIEGYDKVEEKHVVSYQVKANEDSEMQIKDVEGNLLCDAKIQHSEAGTYSVDFVIPKIAHDYAVLHWQTNKQKIQKKIYLDV